ncbi:hypothetical protein RB195_019413 [Necator americanus]|uniref:Uncharacterized protein n=1 Tax=Necator americanus TaxID=51031 RepID=A0ABR1CE29_NECAM
MIGNSSLFTFALCIQEYWLLVQTLPSGKKSYSDSRRKVAQINQVKLSKVLLPSAPSMPRHSASSGSSTSTRP